MKLDELFLIARQYRRVERDSVVARGFQVQLDCNLLPLFVQDTRPRAQYGRIAVPLCYRINEPVWPRACFMSTRSARSASTIDVSYSQACVILSVVISGMRMASSASAQ